MCFAGSDRFFGRQGVWGNPFLGAVIGMIMIHPDLQNAWTVSSGVGDAAGVRRSVRGAAGGLPGACDPVIIAVWVMMPDRKRLHKIVPAMIDLFVTPLVSVFVTGYLTLGHRAGVHRVGKQHHHRRAMADHPALWPGQFVMGGL